MQAVNDLLAGKKGIVMGVANEHSIAWGCAKLLKAAGAEVLIAYGHPKSESYVQPLADSLENTEAMFCDVKDDATMEALFNKAEDLWSGIDFVIHSLAFCPLDDLHGRTVDCSREGFAEAMTVSCHSFLNAARLAEPLMNKGGSLITMTYYGSEKVVPYYNIMGPVKAALESCVRYTAFELGDKGIRTYAISPGPIKTRAASGINHFEAILNKAADNAPADHSLSIDDVGMVACSLVSDLSVAISGQTIYVDSGYSILGAYDL